MWCLVWCRVQSDKTDLTGLIASCFWKATPLSQLCCPSVCKFHPLIEQKKETRDFSCIGELYFLTEKNMIKTTQVLQGRKYIDRSGMDGGDGGRNLSLLLSSDKRTVMWVHQSHWYALSKDADTPRLYYLSWEHIWNTQELWVEYNDGIN